MVHTDAHSRMMFLADIEERHELAFDLLQLSRILFISIFQMLERAPRVDIVARIDAHLLAITGSDISRMGREVDVGHEWCLIAVGL